MKREIAEAWGGFLASYAWDWFLTLTFRESTGTFRAHRLFRQFAQDIEKAVNAPIGWFRGDEYGLINGRFHIHALMLNVGHLYRFGWIHEWNRRAGWARILPFDATKGAAYYCSKYVTKDLGDYEFSDNLEVFKGVRAPIQPPLILATESRTVTKRESLPPLGAPSRPKFRDSTEDGLIAEIEKEQTISHVRLLLDAMSENGQDH